MSVDVAAPRPPGIAAAAQASPPDHRGPHRFRTLDSWRGLCALAVVFYHFRVISHISTSPIVRYGNTAVDFFFVLSGFVITFAYGDRLKRSGGFESFAIRRFGRLYPLHLATLAALVLMELAKAYVVAPSGQAAYRPAFSGPTSLGSLAANLFLLQGLPFFTNFSWNIPSWSVSVEFYVCLLYGLVARSKARDLLFLLLFLAALTVEIVLRVERIWPYEGQGALIKGVCGFFLGTQIHRLYPRLARAAPVRRVAGWAEWSTPVIIAGVIWLESEGLGFLAVLPFGLIVVIFSVEAGLISRLLKTKPLEFLGRISYSVYLTHYVMVLAVFGMVAVVGPRFGMHLRAHHATAFIDVGSAWGGDALQLGFVALVIGCSTLTYRYIEVPGRDFVNGFARRFAARRVRRIDASSISASGPAHEAMSWRKRGRSSS